MEHSSPFAQRLKSISARRKLQELILSTRLDLEQEKLRAQRLKRKSLREQWLMEGTVASPDDRDPLIPLREAETRIEELQQSLTSLQIQMQQLDNLETRKVPSKPPLEEPVRETDEANQSPEDPEKVDRTAWSSSEGRIGVASAPASPRKPANAEAKETLQNGGTQDGDLFGSEGGARETEAKAIPVAAEEGGYRPHREGPEAPSAASPAGQSPEPSKAPAGRQRKLAMEEMVIRDHLGHEVGCMDAVGQDQGSLEEGEDWADLEDGCGRGSRPGPVDGVLGPKEALGEGPPDQELGGRDGPEGQPPVCQGLPSPSGLPRNENGSPEGLEDRPLGPPAEEAGGAEAGQEEVPGQGAREMPGPAPAPGDTPRTESGSQGNETETFGAAEEGRGPAEFSHPSQVQAEDPVTPPPPEVEPFALEGTPSSWHETEKTVSPQGEELTRQGAEGALLGMTPSSNSQLPSLPGHTVPLLDTAISALEEPPAAPEGPKPTPPEAQLPPRPDSDVFLPNEFPLPVGDPGEAPVALPDHLPPAPQDAASTSPAGESPPSSLPGVDGALPDEVRTPPPSQTAPHPPEEEGSSPDQGLPASGEPSTPSPLGQAPSSEETAESLPRGRSTLDGPEERSPSAEEALSPDKAREASVCPEALPPVGQEALQPLPEKMEGAGDRDTRGSGDAGRGDAAEAGEATEALEDLCPERQPLLKGDPAPGGPRDVPAGDPPPKSGILKPPAAAGQRAPNDGVRTSAHAASSHPAQAELPRQGEDQEPEKSQQKPQSCQCCVLM